MAPVPPFSRDDIAAHLAGTRLFGLLEPPELAALADLFEPGTVAAGQRIAHQDEIDASLSLVVGGQVALDRREPDGSRHRLGVRGYGTTIGERGVFLGEPRGD